MKKFLRGLATAALFGIALSPFAPATAAQAGHFHSQTVTGCELRPGINPQAITKVSGGQFNQNEGSTVFTTTQVDDAVFWKTALAVPVKLSSVTQLSYEVKKVNVTPGPGEPAQNLAAAAAYRVYLDNGKTLFYEPYYQPGTHLDSAGNVKLDNWYTYDVDAGKFWETGEGGGSYAGNRTLAQFKALYPNAKVTHIGVGQGTYNVSTRSRFRAVTFGASELCVQPSASASASASASPSPSGGGTPSTRPVGQDSLPVTGSKPLILVGGGVAVLAVGILLVAVGRRKRVSS